MLLELAIATVIATILAVYFHKKQQKQTEEFVKLRKSITNKIFARNVESYPCDLQFDVLEHSDPDNARSRVMQSACEWVRKIEADAINVKDIEISGYGKARELQMTKGSVKITLPNSTSSAYLIDNNLEASQSSNIHIETTDYDLMDTILTQSDQAYWVFTWNVSTPYDVPSLVAMIRDATAKEPPHFSDYKVSYMLPQVSTIDFRVDIQQKSLALVCNQRPPNQGFYRAHKVFSPTNIIEILLTEINYNESQRMLSQAIVKPG